jgi:hypothetical protein
VSDRLNILIAKLKKRKFSRILVTGPNRSGTTISGRILAHELGFTFYPEERITAGDVRQFIYLFCTEENFVLQAPGMCHVAHELNHPKSAVIFMLRNPEDIRASEMRIGYHWTDGSRYFRDTISAEEQVQLFKKYQAKNLKRRVFYLHYEDLQEHALFIEKKLRKNFAPRQISKKENFAPSIKINKE